VLTVTLSIEEISDRIEISDDVTRYSYGLDQRKWSEWDLAFSPDAVIDFALWGIEPCSPAELQKRFRANDTRRISGQHLLSNQVVWLDGDAARSHVEYNLTTLTRSDTEGFADRNRGGGYYEDQLTRTSAGWRIRYRRGIGKWHVQDQIPWP
jgi:hypothetical protein